MTEVPDSFDPKNYQADVTREKNVVRIKVPGSYSEDTRIDKFLTRFYPESSRTKIQRSIQKGHIAVNGEEVEKSYIVAPNDHILFRLIRKPPMQAEPEDIPINVVYEDQDLLVVNKPAGMVVHPAPGHRSGTLVHALLHHVDGEQVSADDSGNAISDEDLGLSMLNALPESPDHPVVRPGIVHRLDKGTSGLLVVAKRDRAHQGLAEQFKEHTVKRHYRAIVWGHFDPPNGTIEQRIGRDPNHRQRMAAGIGEGGKWAATHYETVERLSEHTSIVDFWLETGRTHQIRVHCKYRDHPILGDPKYGGQTVRYGTQSKTRRTRFGRIFELFPYPALHAYRLGFEHPLTNEWLDFESDLPESWSRVIKLITKKE